ncbi:MAG: hypothetical protein ACK4ZJ_16925, partial [Allorhizobium sp.]
MANAAAAAAAIAAAGGSAAIYDAVGGDPMQAAALSAASMLKLALRMCRGSPDVLGFFFSELCDLVCDPRVPLVVVQWVSEVLSAELEGGFLGDHAEDGPGVDSGSVEVEGEGGAGSSSSSSSSGKQAGGGAWLPCVAQGAPGALFMGAAVQARAWGNLDGKEAHVALTVVPLVASPDPGDRDKLLSLCPLLRLVAACEVQLRAGRMDEIDACLGCPIVMFDQRALDVIDSLSATVHQTLCLAMWYMANWLRELINSFA